MTISLCCQQNKKPYFNGLSTASKVSYYNLSQEGFFSFIIVTQDYVDIYREQCKKFERISPMKKIILSILLVFMILLSSCGSDEETLLETEAYETLDVTGTHEIISVYEYIEYTPPVEDEYIDDSEEKQHSHLMQLEALQRQLQLDQMEEARKILAERTRLYFLHDTELSAELTRIFGTPMELTLETMIMCSRYLYAFLSDSRPGVSKFAVLDYDTRWIRNENGTRQEIAAFWRVVAYDRGYGFRYAPTEWFEFSQEPDTVELLEQLIAQIDMEAVETEFYHGLTASEVTEAFLQNSELHASFLDFLGVALEFGEGQILVNERYIFATGNVLTLEGVGRPNWRYPKILLSYIVCPATFEITWEAHAYCVGDWWPGLRIVPPPRPAHRHFTDMETVTVHFYNMDIDTWELYYEEVVLSGENFGTEFIHRMQIVAIRDMWLDGEKLYVDLYPRMFGLGFVGWGDMIRAERMMPTFYSIPFITDLSITISGDDDIFIYLEHITEWIARWRPWRGPEPENAVYVTAPTAWRTIALTEDGGLWTWGRSGAGVLGDGAISSIRRSPIRVLENVVSVTASGSHTLAITENGTLYAWGVGQFGAVGVPFEWNDIFPSPVVIMENVVYTAVNAGHYGARSYAITTSGTLYAWGRNSSYRNIIGILGDGTEEDQFTPVPIMENVAKIVPTIFGGFAIQKDGTLWEWGITQLKPVQVMENVASVHVLNESYIPGDAELPALAVTTDGGLWQLETVPVLLLENIVTAERTRHGGFAIDTNGALWAWGHPDELEPLLGNGTKEGNETPEIILENVRCVTAKGSSAFAITTDGTLWAWGMNAAGQLGDGTTLPRLYPTRIMNNVISFSVVYEVVIRQNQTYFATQAFAVTDSGFLYAWGGSTHESLRAYLGDGTEVFSNTPIRVI